MFFSFFHVTAGYRPLFAPDELKLICNLTPIYHGRDGTESEFPMVEFVLTEPERQRRDSLFSRRLVGGAFIAGLILLGLVFPVTI
jgi:hypothetical protein